MTLKQQVQEARERARTRDAFHCQQDVELMADALEEAARIIQAKHAFDNAEDYETWVQNRDEWLRRWNGGKEQG
jgi:hypothetical protein